MLYNVFSDVITEEQLHTDVSTEVHHSSATDDIEPPLDVGLDVQQEHEVEQGVFAFSCVKYCHDM